MRPVYSSTRIAQHSSDWAGSAEEGAANRRAPLDIPYPFLRTLLDSRHYAKQEVQLYLVCQRCSLRLGTSPGRVYKGVATPRDTHHSSSLTTIQLTHLIHTHLFLNIFLKNQPHHPQDAVLHLHRLGRPRPGYRLSRLDQRRR